jgi:hypothetical protein
MKKIIGISVLITLATCAIIVSRFLTATVNVLEPGAPGFTPVKDDAAAESYAPTLLSNDTFGFPRKCYYRAARDGSGNLHIAYHPVWEYERNDSGGLMPFLSRMFYTGGLKIQRIMFGKGDVEVIAVTVDRRGVGTELRYERPKDYNPATFTVKHEKVALTGTFVTMPAFRVSSWNHLFEKADGPDAAPRPGERAWRCEPEYFTDALWEEYTMVRLNETRLRKSRAHFVWERTSAK